MILFLILMTCLIFDPGTSNNIATTKINTQTRSENGNIGRIINNNPIGNIKILKNNLI